MKEFNINWNFPWKKSVIKTEIDQNNKITAAQKHRNKILALLQNHFENIIIYSDGSKLSDTQAGAECYISYAYDKQKSYSWHLKSTIEAFDIEFFAILKSLQLAKQNVNSLIKNIWIFSDNQSAVQRICKDSISSDQEISYKIQCEAEYLLSQNIQLHICWVPSHMNIYDNEQTDKAAKIAAAANYSSNVIDCSDEIGISLTYLKRKIKTSLIQFWHNYYDSVKKEAYYQNLDLKPAWKPANLQLKSSRLVWSSYIQLKLGHGYFKSYLKRLSDYDSDKCDCNDRSIQSPAHLLLSCSKYQAEYSKIKDRLKVNNLSLKILLIKRDAIQTVFDFLKETKIARRNWLNSE